MTLHLPTLVLLWLAGSIILMPLSILVIRFAVIPLVTTLLHPSDRGDSARIARLEEKVGRLSLELERLARTGSHTAGD
ncbi:MAG TPA: hypothetical protein VF167_11150 [Longimicrobiaceae bacterium]